MRATHPEDRYWRKQEYLKGRKDAETALASDSSHSNYRQRENQRQSEEDYSFMSSSSLQDHKLFFADSGATRHMSDRREMFEDFLTVKPGVWPAHGIGKDNKPLFVLGIGNVRIRCLIDNSWHGGVLSDVLYVPNIGANLFSIGAAARRGCKAIFEDDTVKLTRNGKVVMTGKSAEQKLYLLDIEWDSSSQHAMVSTVAASLRVWHQRLGQKNNATISKMSKTATVDGLSIASCDSEDEFCEGCVLGKQHRLPFPKKGRTRATRRGQIVHSDVVGPMKT